MREEIEQLKSELEAKGIDVEKALENIYATLSFYLTLKSDREIILVEKNYDKT